MNVKWIAAAGLGMFLVASTASAQDAKIAQGEKLYTAQKCSMCHQVAGKGNKVSPLDDVGSRLKAEEIHEWLVNPKEMAAKAKSTKKPPMPSYAKLSKEELDALTAYLSSLKKK